MSWLIRSGHVDRTADQSHALRASGIKRNPESKRERYVTHDEYRDVHAEAPDQVRAMMDLTYRTLQRPESDILGLDSRQSGEKGRETYLARQSSQGKGNNRAHVVDIALSPDLDALLTRFDRRDTEDRPPIDLCQPRQSMPASHTPTTG
jgi:hypothetical protein